MNEFIINRLQENNKLLEKLSMKKNEIHELSDILMQIKLNNLLIKQLKD